MLYCHQPLSFTAVPTWVVAHEQGLAKAIEDCDDPGYWTMSEADYFSVI